MSYNAKYSTVSSSKSGSLPQYGSDDFCDHMKHRVRKVQLSHQAFTTNGGNKSENTPASHTDRGTGTANVAVNLSKAQ